MIISCCVPISIAQSRLDQRYCSVCVVASLLHVILRLVKNPVEDSSCRIWCIARKDFRRVTHTRHKELWVRFCIITKGCVASEILSLSLVGLLLQLEKSDSLTRMTELFSSVYRDWLAYLSI